MEAVDIKTAFLYGVLDEEIYMKIPEGLEDYIDTSFGGDGCLILDKVIYGLVQAARQFHRNLTNMQEYAMPA